MIAGTPAGSIGADTTRQADQENDRFAKLFRIKR
jgi:hypothetical protein